uniref:Paraneoplastic antigen Ma1 homolog n=1 Tax=Oryzias latipes TaxID=8090 RepID=A0A3P9MIN7_ORYLA
MTLSLPADNWCRGEGVDTSHALMAMGISEETPVDTVELALETIKAIGKVRVRGKMFDPDSNTVTVLCECREEIDSTKVPTELVVDEGVKWTLVTVEREQSSGLFSEKLVKFLQDEGKSLDDVTQLCSPVLSANQNAESVIRALNDLAQSPKNNEHSSYRRLRTFSGVHPTPPGEDNLDNWMEHAKFMVDEYEYTDREKKRRIVESLKGPALEIIQAVRMSNPDATHMDYIEVLESTFGTVESGEELYFTFKALHQKPNECLSDFLLRLERTLNKVVKRGGLNVHEVNKARLEQLIKAFTLCPPHASLLSGSGGPHGGTAGPGLGGGCDCPGDGCSPSATVRVLGGSSCRCCGGLGVGMAGHSPSFFLHSIICFRRT